MNNRMTVCPTFTMSDQGTENNMVANVQTRIRQRLDDTLDNVILHRWMVQHGNIKPEVFWSGFRFSFAPGYQRVFEQGGFDARGLYDHSELIDR